MPTSVFDQLLTTSDSRLTSDEKMDLHNYAVLSLKMARIRLVVTGFKDVLDGPFAAGDRGTDHEMFMDYHPRVRRENKRLFIKSGGATIRFEITDDKDRPDVYYPIGIAFAPIRGITGAGGVGRIGRLNFAQEKIRLENNLLFVTDEYKDLDGNDEYKFSVIIQEGSTARIGIIDPGIEHEN